MELVTLGAVELRRFWGSREDEHVCRNKFYEYNITQGTKLSDIIILSKRRDAEWAPGTKAKGGKGNEPRSLSRRNLDGLNGKEPLPKINNNFTFLVFRFVI